MHKKLKFSFGHIMAFIAMIFWCYITFLSISYFTGGDYLLGASISIIITIVLLVLSFCLPLLKAVNNKFEKFIIRERLVFGFMTIICLCAFIPYSHFWTVKAHEDRIYKCFEQSLQTSAQLFTDYDVYSEERFTALDNSLKEEGVDSFSAMIKMKGLVLELQPESYISFKEEAIEWIEKSKKTISIWNVFLMGDVYHISESMLSWHNLLQRMSSHTLGLEPDGTESFNMQENVNSSKQELLNVVPLYTETNFPIPIAWITGLFALFMFYLPWLIQKRSPKSLVTFLGLRKIKEGVVLVKTEKINYQHKSSQLERNDSVTSEHHGQTLDSNTSNTASGRKAMTLKRDDSADIEN